MATMFVTSIYYIEGTCSLIISSICLFFFGPPGAGEMGVDNAIEDAPRKDGFEQRQILFWFDLAPVSVWSCSSNGSTALMSERDSPSDRPPWLSRSVLEVVRLGRRWSVGSALVSVYSSLPRVKGRT